MNTITMMPVSDILRDVNDSLDIGAYGNEVDWFAILAAKVSHNHFDKLADDIMANGFTLPIVLVPNGDGYKVGNGHHRLSAAILLGLSAIPVIVAHDGDYWCIEDSHDGEWEPGDRSTDYWSLISENFPDGYRGDIYNEDHRAQFEGDANDDYDYAARECGNCGEALGCATCHVCESPRCGDCAYDEEECICRVVTPEDMRDDEFAYIWCQDCMSYGYLINHAACGIERVIDEAYEEDREHAPILPRGAWHPEAILADAYAQHAEWLKDEPLRQARREWQAECAGLRQAIERGCSDTHVNIYARRIRDAWEAYQAL